MYTLTYESRAIDGLSSAQIEKILLQSRKNNLENKITGCLISYNDRFIQLLEGDEKKVKEVYAKIKLDSRHDSVTLLSEDFDVGRTFPNWGMAFYPIDENTVYENELEQFKRNLNLLADFSSPTNATAVLFWKRMKFLIWDS